MRPSSSDIVVQGDKGTPRLACPSQYGSIRLRDIARRRARRRSCLKRVQGQSGRPTAAAKARQNPPDHDNSQDVRSWNHESAPAYSFSPLILSTCSWPHSPATHVARETSISSGGQKHSRESSKSCAAPRRRTRSLLSDTACSVCARRAPDRRVLSAPDTSSPWTPGDSPSPTAVREVRTRLSFRHTVQQIRHYRGLPPAVSSTASRRGGRAVHNVVRPSASPFMTAGHRI